MNRYEHRIIAGKFCYIPQYQLLGKD